MAQTDSEMAKDMVVALLGHIKEIDRRDFETDATKLGKAIAGVYKEVFKGVTATYQEVIVDRKK